MDSEQLIFEAVQKGMQIELQEQKKWREHILDVPLPSIIHNALAKKDYQLLRCFITHPIFDSFHFVPNMMNLAFEQRDKTLIELIRSHLEPFKSFPIELFYGILNKNSETIRSYAEKLSYREIDFAYLLERNYSLISAGIDIYKNRYIQIAPDYYDTYRYLVTRKYDIELPEHQNINTIEHLLEYPDFNHTLDFLLQEARQHSDISPIGLTRMILTLLPSSTTFPGSSIKPTPLQALQDCSIEERLKILQSLVKFAGGSLNNLSGILAFCVKEEIDNWGDFGLHGLVEPHTLGAQLLIEQGACLNGLINARFPDYDAQKVTALDVASEERYANSLKKLLLEYGGKTAKQLRGEAQRLIDETLSLL